MRDALHLAGIDGTPKYALLDALLHGWDDAPENFAPIILSFEENRARTLQAAHRFLTGVQEIISPVYRKDDEELREEFMVLGWWEGLHEETGDVFQLILSPTQYGSDGEWVLVGPDIERTFNLAREIVHDATAHTTRCLLYTGGTMERRAANPRRSGCDELG